MSWFIEALKKYAVFSGRSRRKEYWYFVIFFLLIGTVLSFVDSVISTDAEFLADIGLLNGIFLLALLLPSIAVTVRRLHDIGRTGWWYLISFIPIIGTIVLLVFTVQDSMSESNRYGSNPKLSS
ncbi:MAG: DUF805 domain-containing protein [Rubrobacteraceae bacterium]